ncbi:MAG: Rieske 2Fe-2S domain-containing protein [Rhodospirillaceae bacterium]|nr:Rieske 2Fe-2S domain-containing protein [Rhodospirillaceae bacterium]
MPGPDGAPAGMVDWPERDDSLVPYAVYLDEEIFRREQERIFQGPVWSYLGLEAEVPRPGDFVASFIGTMPVVFNRGRDGRLNGFVNRCAHRGATVVRERRGNCKVHTCLYHQWSYDAEGKLVGIPYRRGLAGSGGFPADFRPEEHGLRKVRVASFQGLVFGTLSDEAPRLEDFLGDAICARLRRVFDRPLVPLGYQRQRVRANWKLMVENVKDSYHGALLHAFNSRFGFFRSTQRGDVTMTGGGMHGILTTYATQKEQVASAFDQVTTFKPELALEDMSIVRFTREHDDDIVTSIISLFPSCLMLHGGTFLIIRQVRPKTAGSFEMVWTIVGFEGEDEERTAMRVKQTANLLGPGGYVSMEDAEAIEATQAALEGEGGMGAGVIALGGRTVENQEHLVTEVAIRGFWKGYRKLMGMEARP